MSISVMRIDSAEECQSDVEEHRDDAPDATLEIFIGSHERIVLCVECARKAFTLIGFMVMSQTGESIQQLVGLKKRKAARS